MRTRRIGLSTLEVSEVGLGGNNFGGRCDSITSRRVIASALDLGVNLIDTSPAYAGGSSESLVGAAVGPRRSDVVIATKFGATSQRRTGDRIGSASYIQKSLESSLRRLRTDYVDLLILHNPDETTPIEETLEALDVMIGSGKVRYAGCSNFTGDQLDEAMIAGRSLTVAGFVCAGGPFNLLERSAERKLAPVCERYGISFMPTLPLAGGLLTGKHSETFTRGSASEKPNPKSTRLGRQDAAPSFNPRDHTRFLSSRNRERVRALVGLSTQERTPGQLSLAWLLRRPWIASVIPGAMTPEQVAENVRAAEVSLTADEALFLDGL